MGKGLKIALVIVAIMLVLSIVGGAGFLVWKAWQDKPGQGKSAYQLAVENGFEGTEEEWLASLVGTEATGIETMYVDEEFHLMVERTDGVKYDAGYVGSGLCATTKGAWIQTLIETYEYPQVDFVAFTFNDIQGSPYQSYIETALAYGIIDPVGAEFKPNSFATREFIAVTAIKCMGYPTVQAMSCVDAEEVSEPQYAQVAVDKGLFALENDNFRPTLVARNSEIDKILEKIYAELSTIEEPTIDEEGFVFRDNVIRLEIPMAYTMARSGNSGLLTAENKLRLPYTTATASLVAGDIFELEGETYKVVSTEQSGDYLLVTWTQPEMYEVFDRIDVIGYAYADNDGFVPAEGVSVWDSDSTISPLSARLGSSGETTIGEDFDKEGTLDLGGGVELFFEIHWTAPKLLYGFDIQFNLPGFGDLVNVRNAYAQLCNINAEVTGGIRTTGEEGFSPLPGVTIPRSYTLGKLPLVGVHGVGAMLDVSLIMEIDGSFQLGFTLKGAAGVQILNNVPKNIGRFHTDFTVGCDAEIKAGPQIGLSMEVFGYDLLEFSLSAGIQGEGSMVYHSSRNLLCVDASVASYADLSAFEGTKIDEWLHCAKTWKLIDGSNPARRRELHIENMVIVPECTYNVSGIIEGVVSNADTRSPISGSKIELYDGDRLVKTVTSGSNGAYTLSVAEGTYGVRISAAGYIPCESTYEVQADQITFAETFLMVEGDPDTVEYGIVQGQITNAYTGGGVEGATLTFRKGWNNTTGEVLHTMQTEYNGYYTCNQLVLGNYTVWVEKEGFTGSSFNVAVTRSGSYSFSASINPDMPEVTGDLRIVLTWGASPSDLDSHLVGPTKDGTSTFHVYFSNKSYYYSGSVADLDVDDTSSYGPETVTIYDMNDSGIYSYYVHDFSNKSTTNGSYMANSSAKVQVYDGTILLYTYYVPVSGRGSVWHVFDYDAATGTIIPVNTFSNQSNADLVGAR